MPLENVYLTEKQKLLTIICGYITAIWGIEPYNLLSCGFIMAVIFIFKLNFMMSNTLLERALLNNFLELLKMVLSDGKLFICWEVLSGRFLM